MGIFSLPETTGRASVALNWGAK